MIIGPMYKKREVPFILISMLCWYIWQGIKYPFKKTRSLSYSRSIYLRYMTYDDMRQLRKESSKRAKELRRKYRRNDV